MRGLRSQNKKNKIVIFQLVQEMGSHTELISWSKNKEDIIDDIRNYSKVFPWSNYEIIEGVEFIQCGCKSCDGRLTERIF